MLAAIGAAIGVVLAGLGSSLLENLLYRVRGLDRVTFGAACSLFTVLTLVATYMRRAARRG